MTPPCHSVAIGASATCCIACRRCRASAWRRCFDGDSGCLGPASGSCQKCIEHGHLMDEATAKLIAERGVWLCIQPFPEEMADAFPPGSEQRAKFSEVIAGMEIAYRMARKYKLKTAWGTDVLFSQALARRQGELLVKLERWYTPAEALVMATGTNAELMAMCGERNPYPGKLGVVEAGALADLLLVDGNPLENIKLMADPAKNFVVIMKDGKIYKNLIR